MPYTPPLGSEANLKFGVGYSAPAGDAANLTWAATPGEVVGNGAFTVDFVVEGHGEFTNVSVDGSGAFAVDFEVAGTGAHGVAGFCSVTVGFDADGVGAHGVAGAGALDLGFSIAGAGTVERYELRGEIRKDGILVNRLVRAYRRDTGELIGEVLSSGGVFSLHTGFEPAEHYIVPIDTASDATDWSPPCANRVLSVLAMDTA